jgi:mono/diheme cytochrome c family protein
MRAGVLQLLSLLGVLAARPVFAASERDLAVEVKAVFQAKCVQCHGPQLPKPKGKFGYVLDLKRLAADPDKVVPGKPEESQLWQLVEDDEMPGEGAKAGPLSKQQKQTIHDWIAAGAPAQTTLASTPEMADNAPPLSPGQHFLDWLGRCHILVIHFPIGLLLAAAAGELWFTWRKGRVPASAVGFCVLLGAVSAIVSAALGWIHAANGYGAGSPVLPWHRWFGVATASGAVLPAVLSALDIRRGRRGVGFRLVLLLETVLVALTGHFGGTLVYGTDFFRW